MSPEAPEEIFEVLTFAISSTMEPHPHAISFATHAAFHVRTEPSFRSTSSSFEKRRKAAAFPWIEAYSPILACSSGVNLAYFPLGCVFKAFETRVTYGCWSVRESGQRGLGRESTEAK